MGKISDSMKMLLDFEEEKELPKLQELANKENAVIIALIATYVPQKVSPSKSIRAELGITEEFGVETLIDQIKTKIKKPKKAYLLLNSFGGGVITSYKIACALKNSFDEIVVFVPHIAASGGTLITLGCNQIVMGMLSNLSPIDVQTYHKGMMVSANSLNKAFGKLQNYFKDKEEADAPYPYIALMKQIDPVIMEEWNALQYLMDKYAKNLLKKGGYVKQDADNISYKLIFGYDSHGQVIGFDDAKDLGLKVVKNTQYPEHWSLMKEWLGKYMLKASASHVIRYIIPERKSKNKKIQVGGEKNDKKQKRRKSQ